MKMKRINKLALFTIVICGLWYTLPKTMTQQNLHDAMFQMKANDISSKTSATHWLIPPDKIGRKLPFHQVYESRRIRFQSDLTGISPSSNITKMILLWTPWNGVKKTINFYSLQEGNKSFVSNKCPDRCIATRNRKHLRKADAVIFHLLDIKPQDLPANRTSKQVWIVYNMEAPWLIKKNLNKGLQKLTNTFNWTMTYRSDSTIPVKYGYIDKSDSKQALEITQNKRNVVWFVSDCKTDSKREDYVKELSKYIDIDVYGECGNLKCYPSQSSACYDRILKRYKFYLSFENSLCRDYVTEKFFNVYNYDTIPVVFGGANYSAIAPEDTFIDATKHPDPKSLAQILLRISRDQEEFEKIIRRKRSFKAYLDPWMCRLCNKLHGRVSTRVVSDVREWWIQDAHCRHWNKRDLAFSENAYF